MGDSSIVRPSMAEYTIEKSEIEEEVYSPVNPLSKISLIVEHTEHPKLSVIEQNNLLNSNQKYQEISVNKSGAAYEFP